MLDELRKLSQNFLTLKNSSYRRYFIQTDPFKHRLSLLLGQRGIGKTTTLVQFLLDKSGQDIYDPSILYVQADHFLVGNSSLYEIAEEFQTMGGKTLALDEIHKYTNWSQELKSIYDTFPKLTVVASGSSALQMYKGSHDLARRAIKFNMYGLSFREFLELRLQISLKPLSLTDIIKNHERLAASVIDAVEQKERKILPLFQQYLKSGYYPYLFDLPTEELYFITLEQSLHTTLEADLPAIYPHLSTSSINKIKALLVFIAKSVPFTPNWNKIKELLEIGDARTVKSYFQYLEDAALIRTIGKDYKKLDHISSIEKVYLDNPNQMYTLTFGVRNVGMERELFFIDMLSLKHRLALVQQGDFMIDDTYIFEVGGRNKSFEQIKGKNEAFLACDTMERGIRKKIPLWIFGLLY